MSDLLGAPVRCPEIVEVTEGDIQPRIVLGAFVECAEQGCYVVEFVLLVKELEAAYLTLLHIL